MPSASILMNIELDAHERDSLYGGVLNSLTMERPDLVLVTPDGDLIWTHQILFTMHSDMFRSILGDMNKTGDISMFVPASALEIRSLLSLLQSGKCSSSQNHSEVISAAKIMGVTLKNIEKSSDSNSKKTKAVKRKAVSFENYIDKYAKLDDSIDDLSYKIEDDLVEETGDGESNLEKFQCKYCLKQLSRMDKLNSHILNKHTKEAKIECQHCEAKFVSDYYLKKHMNALHPNEKHHKVKKENRSQESSYVSEVVEESQETNEHIEINTSEGNQEPSKEGEVDTALKSHSCSKCDRRFSRADHLTSHMRSVHEGVTFECQYCSKQLSRKDKLKDHILRKHCNEMEMDAVENNDNNVDMGGTEGESENPFINIEHFMTMKD